MSQQVSNTDRYPATPSQLMEMMQNPEYLAEKYAALGDRQTDVVEQTADGGGLRIKVERVATAPDALKKFGETSKMVQTENWRPDGDGYAADLKIESQGVAINGTLKIAAAGDAESDWTANLDIKSSIPLLGGKIEKAVAAASKDNMAVEYQFNKEWLASHS